MLKNITPKLTAIIIITLLIAGVFGYVQYLINKPLKILKNYTIPKEFTFNNTKIALAWTDENEGETLIIQSDKKEYSGFSSVDVYFSITNISKKDQSMDVVVWVGNEKVKVEEMERIEKEDSNFYPSSEYKQFSIFNFQTISNDLINKISNRKDIGGSDNGYSVNDNIESGQTNYYKATIKYPPMSKGEFFIEAFSAKGGYGHLDPWYSSSWNYRREITINSSQIATTTSNFPVLATTTLDDLKTTTNGGKVGNDNGYDIIFVDDDDSTLLNFEREKYASTTGEIVYWIKTDISSTTDKTIYMYYGNASTADQATTTGVWDDNFVMVQHMHHDWDATAEDSTKYNNDGTNTNFYSATSSVTAQIDGGIDFDGADDYVDLPNVFGGLDEFTVSAFVNFDVKTNYDIVIISGVQGADYSLKNWILSLDNSVPQKMRMQISNGTENVNAVETIAVSSGFTHYSAVYDGQTVRLYKNSIEDDSESFASPETINNVQNNTQIGAGYSQSLFWTAFWDGFIDEIRISNIARSAGWIETEYNNQSNVSSFLTINAEESLKLVITTSAKTLAAGTESTAFIVQTQGLSNNPINMVNDITINLSSDSSLYSFASTTGGIEISSVTIPSGTSSVDFYYTDYEVGSPTIVVAATNFVSDDQQQMIKGVWQNTSYQCRRQITIDSSQIATTTSAFPVLATTTLVNLKTVNNGGYIQNDSGHDIIFVDDDNSTVLNYEREKYASTTGEIVYWIKTDISSTTDKTIYMYYGNASATDQATTTGVWDDNFVMVQHMREDPSGSAPQMIDSTANNNDGTSANFYSATSSVAGQIDGSLDFDGGDDYIDILDGVAGGHPFVSLSDAITITAFINPAAITNTDSRWRPAYAVVELRNQGTTGIHAPFSFGVDDSKILIGATDDYIAGEERHHGDTTINTSIWYYIAATFSGDNWELFLDGQSDGSGSWAAASGDRSVGANTANLQIGCRSADDGLKNSSLFNGIIDEVRISNTVRHSGWIETEYNNQVSVGSFMTFGAEVCMPNPIERSGGENVKTMIKGGVRFKGGTRF
ncbi:DUF2341 domain-containing protein [Candidatus Parcubacteria bacterium]|nr:DUF2341 domain-containing protein [Candidatus Parcubacteria bacterium]